MNKSTTIYGNIFGDSVGIKVYNNGVVEGNLTSDFFLNKFHFRPFEVCAAYYSNSLL